MFIHPAVCSWARSAFSLASPKLQLNWLQIYADARGSPRSRWNTPRRSFMTTNISFMLSRAPDGVAVHLGINSRRSDGRSGGSSKSSHSSNQPSERVWSARF